MTGMTLCFVFIGVGVASANLMKLVEWLDTPRPTRRRARHAAARDNTVEFPRAELELESVLYAA
ncbi:MAG: hypothetical protein IJV43_00760 [Oscillospiraceae bacterium]|nr:hypothetical protein [Oscillospiraceae bacterium]